MHYLVMSMSLEASGYSRGGVSLTALSRG
jgi:hypothetical protein